MFDFSPVQIIIVLVIALLVFGPKRLPEMGRNLGRSMREFKSSVSGEAPEPAAPAASAGARSAEQVDARQEAPSPTPEIALLRGNDRDDPAEATPAPTREVAEAEAVEAEADERRTAAARAGAAH